MNGLIALSICAWCETSALEILSWIYRGEIPCIPSRGASSFSSLIESSVNPGNALAVVQLEFLQFVIPAFFGFG
jgi:hypothetical protein